MFRQSQNEKNSVDLRSDRSSSGIRQKGRRIQNNTVVLLPAEIEKSLPPRWGNQVGRLLGYCFGGTSARFATVVGRMAS